MVNYVQVPQLGFSKLPPNEEAICVRFREVRLAAGLSQTEFAQQLRITRERVASYEYARAPVKWGLGTRLCSEFHLSQRWIATGALPLLGWYDSPEAQAIADDELFSSAYDKLEPQICRWLKVLQGDAVPNSKERIRRMRENLNLSVSFDAKQVPDSRFEEYFAQLSAFSRGLLSSYGSHTKKLGRQAWDEVRERYDEISGVHHRLLLNLPRINASVSGPLPVEPEISKLKKGMSPK